MEQSASRNRRAARAAAALAVAAVAGGTLSARAESPDPQNATCAAMISDLESQIEQMKKTAGEAQSFTPPAGLKEKLARERREADELNEMFPALGCAKLDIDGELKKPAKPELLRSAPARSGKKHKRKVF